MKAKGIVGIIIAFVVNETLIRDFNMFTIIVIDILICLFVSLIFEFIKRKRQK